MTPTAKPVIAIVSALVLLAGCTTKVRPVAPHELGTVDEGQWLLIETMDGVEVAVKDVAAESTRLVGVDREGQRREIPVDSIRSVRVKTKSATLLYTMVPIAAVAVWLAVSAANAPEPPPPPPSVSCPLVYAYDGRDLVFEAEPYGGAIAPALRKTDWTPLPHLREIGGEFRIRIANELDETQYTDEARLVVVDHPLGTRVAADPAGQLHVLQDPAPPARAVSQSGRDVTDILRDTDGRAWLAEYGSMNERSRETLRDPLVLEFGKPPRARTARLLVSGTTSSWGAEMVRDFLALHGRRLPEWYGELEAHGPALQDFLEWYAREGLYTLPIEVETEKGWQVRGVLFGSGPFAYKTTAYALDVSDVPGDTLRLRLPFPVNFWVLNSVAVDFGEQPPVEVREIETSTVRDRRDREVQRLLATTDGAALVMSERHDHTDLAYPAPPPSPGRARTVLLKISGHYDIRMAAEGEPQEAVLQRLHSEPGFTLRFAFDRHLERTAGAEGPAKQIVSR